MRPQAQPETSMSEEAKWTLGLGLRLGLRPRARARIRVRVTG
jgi:hypothetical protein